MAAKPKVPSRLIRLYEFAFDADRLLAPGKTMDAYYGELLTFVANETDTPYIILRQQADYDKDRLVVLASHNIDKNTTDSLTDVRVTSPIIRLLTSTGKYYYAEDIETDSNIVDKQREFLLAAGIRSAIYTPIFRHSTLRAFIAYFRRKPRGFSSSQRTYLASSLARVIAYIYGFTDRLFEANNDLVKEFREANRLLSVFSGSFHDAKGYFENSRQMLSYLRTDIGESSEVSSTKRQFLLEGLNIVADQLELIRLLVYEPLQAQEIRTSIPCLLELIREASEPLGRKFREVQLTFSAEIPEPIPIRGREAHLKRLFFNLILNALQATRDALAEDGIQVGHVEVVLGRSPNPASVLVEIKDNGIGIPEELLPKIFERGFTTWQHQGGTGLGLYLARRTMEREGGDIKVESKPGVGTKVSVVIPVSPSAESISLTPV